MKKSIYLVGFFVCLCGSIFSQQTTIQVNAAIDGTTINTCNGFIIDSGGQGGTGYSNDEDVVFTICPDNPDDIVNVQFNLFDLDVFDDNPLPGGNQVNLDYMFVYDGNSTSANFLGQYSGTELQGVLIQCSPQNTSGCLTFRFKSNSQNTQNGFFTASAQCVTPCDDPTAGGRVLGGFTNDSIHACIGEVLSFENFGSFAQPGFNLADYEWDFMDGSTANGQQVNHSYTIPGHYRVQLFVTDDNGCTNNNLIDIDVLVATPPNFVNFLSDTTLCVGESLDLHATPLLYENTWSGFSGSATIDDGCLPDTLLGIAQSIDVTQTGFASGTSITDPNQIQSLCLELEHSFMGDLVIMVTCPNGQNVILHQQGGGGTQIGEPNQNDNVDCSDPTTQGVPYNYCFTNTATQTWVDYGNQFGGTLPAGDYEPIQPLSNLVGCPTNGVWTLTVVDNWAADDGTVFSFAITLDSTLYADVVEFTPQHGQGSDSSYWSFPAIYASNLSPDADNMTVTPTSAGTYTYVYNIENSFGCHDDTSVTVTVFDFNLPFNLVDTTICAGNPLTMINAPELNCDYTLRLYDSWGDGWNGNSLLLSMNGGAPTPYTLTTGTYGEFPFPVQFGDNVSFIFDGMGSFINECSYEIVNCNNTVVFTGSSPLNSNPNSIMIGPFDYPVEFTWSPPNLFDSLVNMPNPEIFISDDVSVGVNVYPLGHPQCAESAFLNISVIPGTYVGLDSSVTICQTTTPEDLFVYLGAGANPNGTWTDPNGTAITMPLDPVTMPEGAYVYTVTANGCTGTATVTVSKASPTIISLVTTDANCTNALNGSVLVTAQNFNTYTLNNGPNIPATSPFTINGLGEGDYTLVLFGTQPECNASTAFSIDDPDSLQIDFITPTTTICNGASANLTAQVSGGNSPYIFTWMLNGQVVSNQQSFTITPTLPLNNYCLTLTEQCGSISLTECVIVQFETNIIPQLATTQNICVGDTSYFQNITNSSDVAASVIYFGDGDSLLVQGLTPFSHYYQNSGSYDIAISTVSLAGCFYTNTLQNFVLVHDNPNADFTVNPLLLTTFEPSGTLVDESTQDVTLWYWSMPGSTPDSSNLQSPNINYPMDVVGEYPVTLVVENFFGCRDSITKVVEVKDVLLLYVPNSFSPNGDELNNTWNISYTGLDVQQFSVWIYNRWGQLVWESHDPSVGWDGTFGNSYVPDGMYSWKMEFVNEVTNQIFLRSGFINVFR